MRWMRALGVLAVVDVLCLALGSAASLGGGLLASSSAVPAAATATVITAGVVVSIFVAGPEGHWMGNPYW